MMSPYTKSKSPTANDIIEWVKERMEIINNFSNHRQNVKKRNRNVKEHMPESKNTEGKNKVCSPKYSPTTKAQRLLF